MLTISRAKSGSVYANLITRSEAKVTTSAGSVESSTSLMVADARSERLSVITASKNSSLEGK